MAASTKVKFLTGLASALDTTAKAKGQILFSIDENNVGTIWYDKSNSVRVRMGEALTFTGDTVINATKSNGTVTFSHTGRGLVYTVIGTQTASTNAWTGRLDDLPDINAVYDGLTILYYLPYAGTTTAATLTLTFANGDKLSNIPVYYTGTTVAKQQFAQGSTILLTYWSSPNIGGTASSARWTRADYDSNSDTIPSAYCGTAAGTAAKGASCTNFSLKPNSYIHVSFRYANSSAGAITLNINSTGAKPIYINGTASSANNYTLPAGTYIAFYDGTNYYFRTDNLLPASIDGNAATATLATKATGDGSGQEIESTYIKALSVSGQTITYTYGDGTTATITTQDTNTDTKVTNTLNTSKKFYITGTESGSTNTGTQLFDTGVYVGTTAGSLYSTTLNVTNRITAERAINQIITGSGVAAKDNGSGNNRYQPATWTFDAGQAAANGDIYTIKVPVAGHDYGVYMSIDGGTTYYPVALNNTGRLTTHYAVNTYAQVIFESTGSVVSIYPLGGGTARQTVTGGVWRILNYYDSGNPGDWNLRQYTIKAQTAITAVHIIGGTDSGYNHIDAGTAFDIRYAVLYANANISAAGTSNNNFIHHYSVNVKNSSGNNVTFTAYKNVYIKGTLSGTTFTPISGGNPYVQDITAADDGYVYYYIGRAYTTSAITFDATGAKMYWYKDGAIRPYANPGVFDWGKLQNIPQIVEGALGSQVTGQSNASDNGYKIQLYNLAGTAISKTTGATNGVILIPYASGDTIGLVSATAQTWKGDKTFSNNIGVSGNGSITGTLGVSGVATFNNTTEASATSTASVVIKGGLGVAKKMFIGDDIFFTSSQKRIGRYINSTTSYTWVYEDYNNGTGGLWIGASGASDNVHAGLLTLHAGLADTTNGYVNQSIKVIIGTSASDNTGATRNLVYTDASENGSGTQPVYVDSNGKITKTTYSLSATIDSGTANRMAYYSGINTIEDAGSIYASADSLAINATSAPANSGKFQVKGTSTMQAVYPESTRSYMLGKADAGWKALYLDRTEADDILVIKGNGTQYANFVIGAIGTASTRGIISLRIGNNIGSGSPDNATGYLELYSTGTVRSQYQFASWTSINNSETYTFLGKTSTATSGASANAYTTLVLGNSVANTSSTAHTEGRLRIYSANTSYHQISGLSTTVTHEHVLPNYSTSADTSWIAVGGNGSNAGVADETQLMYLSTAGVLTASTTSVGGFSGGEQSHKPVYLDAGVITEYDYELSATVRAADEILTGEQWGVAYYKSVDEIVATPAGDDHQILQAHTSGAPDWVDAFTNLSWSGQTTASVDINATVAGVSLSATIPVADGTTNDTKSGIITNTTQSIAGNKTFMADTYVRNNLYVGTLNSTLGSVYFYTGNNYTTRLTMNSTTNVTGNRNVYMPNYNGDMYLVHTEGAAAVGSTQQPIYIADNGRATAITAANLATFVDGQHKWVRIGGDTMTGNLTINHSYARVNFYDGTRTVMWVGKSNATAAYMGLYSQGYYTTDGTWTDDAKYIVYRAPGGDIYLNGQAARLPDRTLTIGSTGKTFNGTANVSWTLAEIGAASSGHNHDSTYLKLTGGTVTGTLTLSKETDVDDAAASTGALIIGNASGTHLAFDGNEIIAKTASTTMGTLYLNESVSINNAGNVTATTFTGALAGNATTATTWKTARTLTIGATGKSVDGSANVSWSKAEILGSSTNAYFYRGDQTWSNTLNGAFTANGTITANGGYLKSTLNSNTVQIGSQNASFCHISNSAAIPFWFNQDITMAQGKHIGQASSQYRPFQIYLGRHTTADSRALNSGNPLIEFANASRDQYAQIVYTDYNNQGGSDSITFVSNQNDLRVYAPKVHGAVWNDYAECRWTDDIEPGYCMMETASGQMQKCNKRMTPGCRIISDTFGMLIGETNKSKTPIAVCGRVLVYTKQDRNLYQLGMPVCAADDGTIDIMTQEEIINHPESIVGTVSEIPTYNIWYAGQYDEDTQRGRLEIPINNRIWIYVK